MSEHENVDIVGNRNVNRNGGMNSLEAAVKFVIDDSANVRRVVIGGVGM